MLTTRQLETSLETYLTPLESKRVQLRRQIFVSAVVYLLLAVAATGACLLLFYNASGVVNPAFKELFIGLCTVFPSALVSLVLWQQFSLRKTKLQKAYRSLIRSEGFLPAFNTWNKSLTYHPEAVIPQKDLDDSQTIINYDLLKGDDYCEGVLEDGRPFRFSEIELLEKKTRWNTNGYEETYYAPLFKGLFFVLEDTEPYSNFKDYLKLTAVWPLSPTKKNSTRAWFKKYDTTILDDDFERNAVRASNFQQSFVFQDSNQAVIATKNAPIEAFSPDFKKRLLHLKEALDDNLLLVFKGTTCYVAAAHQGEFWKVPIRNSLAAGPIRQELAANFTRCFMILDELAAMTNKRV